MVLWRWGDLQARLRSVLRLDEEPWRIAAGLALGVFISFSPYYGLHTVLVVLLASLLRLNLAATFAGSFVVLPWFIPFVWAGCIKVGRLLLGGRGPVLTLPGSLPPFLGEGMAAQIVADNVVPLIVGTAVVGGIAAALTYVLALKAIARARRPSPAP